MAQLLSLVVNGITRLNNDTYGKNIYADKFIKNGSSDSYVLLGGGGEKAISDFAPASHGVHWDGFTKRTSSYSWGTLTSSNSYTPMLWMDSTNGGGVAFSDKSGQTSMQIDGYFYQVEGAYRVTDVTETVTALGTSGNTITWTKNGVTSSITVPYATKAAQDGNGNTISSYYLPLVGGTLTGPLEIKSTSSGSYNEGLRISVASNNWAGITFGGTGLSGAPTNGWFAALNPSDQFIISPNDSSNTTGLTLNSGGNALWRNNILIHAGNYTSYVYSKSQSDDRYVSLTTDQTITGIKNFNTATNSKPVCISRTGGSTAEVVKIGVNDSATYFNYVNDETSCSFIFSMENTDSESGGGAGANTSSVVFNGSSSGAIVKANGFYKHDGTSVSYDGHTHDNRYYTETEADNRFVNVSGDTMTGTLIMSGITASNWSEGIRINDAANGWTTLTLGGTKSAGTDSSTWSLHTYQKNFYINRNGSSDTTDHILCNVSGYWGIGTNSPSYKLDVHGKAGDGSPVLRVNVTNCDNQWTYPAEFLVPNLSTSRNAALALGVSMTSGNSGILYYSNAGNNNDNNYIGFGIHGTNDILTIFKKQRVGVKTADPLHTLHVNGTLRSGIAHIGYSSPGKFDDGLRLYGSTKASSWSNINFGCDPAATDYTHDDQWMIGRNSSNEFMIGAGGNYANTQVTFSKNGEVSFQNTVTIKKAEHSLKIYKDYNYHPCVTDNVGRPGISISGNYPYIWLTGGGTANTAHGSTITLCAPDTAKGTDGKYKMWTFGVPGQNATWMDLAYSANFSNPHNGIDSWIGSGTPHRIMRWRVSPQNQVLVYGTGTDGAASLIVSSSRTGTWIYGASFFAPDMKTGDNIWVNIGKSNSVANSFGFSWYNAGGAGSTSNYGAAHVWGCGDVLKWYADLHSEFMSYVKINASTYPSIICNAKSGKEANIRFDLANVTKAYVGYNEAQGAWVYNDQCDLYLALSDGGIPHVSGKHLAVCHSASFYTDNTLNDTTSTSMSDFITRLNYSGLFSNYFGMCRGSWYYVAGTQYNTGVGTIEMAGTAVLNMSASTAADEHNKTLLFIEGPTGNLYSYVKQSSGYNAIWSRYVKTTDTIANATNARYVIADNNAKNPGYALLHSGSGRADASPDGDTWIYWDVLGGTASPWGFMHQQYDNLISFYGAGKRISYIDLANGFITAETYNSWLSPARTQIGRKDTTVYTDRSCIGTTDGNLHLDAYKGKEVYFNYYSTAGNVYFNGGTYYINGGYYNGRSAMVTVNYNNDANSTYQMLWGSGNYIYGTSGIYCNPSTDAMYAARYYATASAGPHFVGTSTSGNWSYIQLSNGSTYWDIATNTSSSSGALWLSRYKGGNNGIRVSSTGRTDIITSETANNSLKLISNGGESTIAFADASGTYTTWTVGRGPGSIGSTYGWWNGAKNVMTLTNSGQLALPAGEHSLKIYKDYNYHPCLVDGAGRPGISISGYYPYIWLMGGGTTNANHGATLTLGAPDSAGSTNGSIKTWTFGVPGQNATWMDLAYSINTSNPHNGINDITCGGSGWHKIMRWNVASQNQVFIYGTGADCNASLVVNSSRTGTWIYAASFLAPSISSGHNVWINVGKANSTRNSFGLSWHHAGGDGSTSNYGAVEIWGIGNVQRWYADGNTTFPLGSVTATAFYESSDERLKDFENDININFDLLKTLPKKYFRWKKKSNTLQLGTSAQSLQKVYPELVSENADGYLTVAYDKLSIIALAAIDKLHDENQDLKHEINLLKQEIQALKKDRY